MENENGKKTWFRFRALGEDIKVAQKRIEELRNKRFEQLTNGEAIVFDNSNKVEIVRAGVNLTTPKVEDKTKVLQPNKRELKQISKKTITFIRGNRRVGRRLVKVKVDSLYYSETINRLLANQNYVVHPRTKDLICGTSTMENQKPNFATNTLTIFSKDSDLELKAKYPKNVALITPAKPYHRVQNQQLRKNYRFILRDKDIVAQKFNSKEETWLDIKPNEVRYKKTYQYKTVWFTKRSRRK